MYIIVIGGGRVGYYLTRELLKEGHEVLLIEQKAEIVERVNAEMGSVGICGDGCEAAILESAGTARADMLIAVTGDDEDNLVACQVAKYKFNVPRTISRVRNPKNENVMQKLGIDVTVSSTGIILEHIEHELPTHPLTHLINLSETGLEIVEIRIPDDSPNINRLLEEIKLPERSLISLVVHRGITPEMPTPETLIKANDRIIAVTPTESAEELKNALIGSKQ